MLGLNFYQDRHFDNETDNNWEVCCNDFETRCDIFYYNESNVLELKAETIYYHSINDMVFIIDQE